jgi:hypothetical protein
LHYERSKRIFPQRLYETGKYEYASKNRRVTQGQMIVFTEEDLKELQERVFQQKMDELFEEPSTYEDDDGVE